jgi:lipoyl(octanoyl) transferase
LIGSPQFSAQIALRGASLSGSADVVLRERGLLDYLAAYAEMREFTARRQPHTRDEIWLVQHPPVYTIGLAGRPNRIPAAGTIPLERVDRGGQITYHGPGQVVMYVLLDLNRRSLKIRELVYALEESVIRLLDGHGIEAARRVGAPGVYVNGAKLAALGLRVRKGATYHGLAMNVDMDLSPFDAIDPCGYPGLAVTQTARLGISADCDTLGRELAAGFAELIEARP